jgi:hypothetical protein
LIDGMMRGFMLAVSFFAITQSSKLSRDRS